MLPYGNANRVQLNSTSRLDCYDKKVSTKQHIFMKGNNYQDFSEFVRVFIKCIFNLYLPLTQVIFRIMYITRLFKLTII